MLGFSIPAPALLFAPGPGLPCCARRCLAEDMRVATLQLVADGGASIVKVKASCCAIYAVLTLEQQITQLAPSGKTLYGYFIEDLVGLLQRV